MDYRHECSSVFAEQLGLAGVQGLGERVADEARKVGRSLASSTSECPQAHEDSLKDLL